MVRKLLLILLLILLPCSAWAATYYVKNGGNDSLDGLSDSTAWASIAKVGATVISGDTVYFRSQDTWTAATAPMILATAGVTYIGDTYGAGTKATLQATGTDGTFAQGMVNVAVGNVTIKGFNINANNQEISGMRIGAYNTASFSNVTVDNCVVQNVGTVSSTAYIGGIYIGVSAGTTVKTVSNVTIKNTTVHDIARGGIIIYPPSYEPVTGDGLCHKVNTVLVQNCTVYNTGIGNGLSDWGYGVDIKNDSDNVTVEFCHLYNNRNGGVHSETVELAAIGVPNNLIVRYNIIHDNYSAGIDFNNVGNKTYDGSFYGNLIYNNGKSSSVYAADILFGSWNFGTSVFNFYNNTIYSTTNGATGLRTSVDAGSTNVGLYGTPTITFKNNIIYTGNYTAILDLNNKLTHSNNLVYRSSSASDEHVRSGTTSYNRAGVLAWEATAQNTNPTFTSGTLPTGFSGTYGSNMVPNTDYFQLTVDSPAKDTGATLEGYTGSINGAGLTTPIVRPLGAAFDIGAYEYGTVAQSGGSAGQGFFLQGVTIR